MTNITVAIPDGNAMESAKREETLKVVAKLPIDDLDRIGKLAENKKALTMLKTKWNTLKLMFG